MRRLLLITLITCAPALAHARRVVVTEREAPGASVPGGAASSMAADPYRTPGRRTPARRLDLDTASLRRALTRAQPELERCLAEAGVRSGTVRARITRDAAMRITPRSRPRSDAAEACMDLAARRHLTPLLGTPVRRAVTASIRVRAPSAPPPPPAGDERELRDRLSSADGALRSCLGDAAPGVPGTVTLRVVAHRDGSMALESAALPTGVPAGPMLVCLQSEVARLRVSPGGERSTSHELLLGR
jgi:hypothetical protein